MRVSGEQKRQQAEAATPVRALDRPKLQAGSGRVPKSVLAWAEEDPSVQGGGLWRANLKEE